MREAELPDGTILEFPDETTDAVMQAAVKRHLAGGASRDKFKTPTILPEHTGGPAITPAEASFMGRSARQGVADIASVLGLPIEAANLALGAGERFIRQPEAALAANAGQPLGYHFPVNKPMLGMEWIREKFGQRYDIAEQPAPTPESELIGRGLRMGVGSAPLSAYGIATAPFKVPAVASELASLFGATIGQQIGSGAGPVGEAVGTIAGGLTPATVPAMATKVGGRVVRFFSPEARAAAARREAEKVFQPSMRSTLDVEQQMAQAQAVENAMGRYGQFTPTIGARTGSPPVQGLERAVAERDIENLSRYARTASENLGTVEAAKAAEFGPRVDVVTRTAKEKVANIKGQLDLRLRDIERQQKGLASQVDRGALQQKGGALREGYWNQRQQVKSKLNAAYEDLYRATDEAGAKVDMTDIAAFVNKVAADEPNIIQTMPTTYGKVAREFGANGKGADLPHPIPVTAEQQAANAAAAEAAAKAQREYSFKGFHSTWKEVNREIGAAVRAGDDQKLYYLNQLKQRLDDKLASFEEAGMGGFADEFRAINQRYRDEYSEVFKRGMGGEIAASGKLGDRLANEDIVGSFFTPTGLDQFQAIYAGDRNAQTFLKDGILGLFAKRAIDETTGMLKPGAAETFLRNNSETLAKVTDVRALLTNTTARNAALAERASRLGKAQRNLDRTYIAKVAGTEDVDTLFTNASKSPTDMLRLLSLAKDERGKQAFARAFADNVPNMASKAGMEPMEYVLANEKVFKPIFDRIGKDHWKNLTMIAGGQTVLERMDVPRAVKIARESGDLLPGSSARALTSAYISIARGRTGVHQELAQILQRYGIKMKETQAMELINEAIYDPRVARDLVEGIRGGSKQVVSNKIGNHLATLASRAALSSGLNEPQQEE